MFQSDGLIWELDIPLRPLEFQDLIQIYQLSSKSSIHNSHFSKQQNTSSMS